MPVKKKKLTCYLSAAAARQVRRAKAELDISASELIERLIVEHCPKYTVRAAKPKPTGAST